MTWTIMCKAPMVAIPKTSVQTRNCILDAPRSSVQSKSWRASRIWKTGFETGILAWLERRGIETALSIPEDEAPRQETGNRRDSSDNFDHVVHALTIPGVSAL